LATEFKFTLTNCQRLAVAGDRWAGFGHNLKVFKTENREAKRKWKLKLNEACGKS